MCPKVVLFIFLLVFATSVKSAVKLEMELDRIEQISGFHLINATGIRVRKFNRTTSIYDGKMEVLQDIGDEYLYTLTVAYSRLGNNQFNEYPMKVPKDKMCDAMNGVYKEHQPYFLNWTNLPRVGDEWFCPIPKGRYWVKELAPDGGWIPKTVAAGYWRFTADILDLEDNVVVRIVVFIRILKSYVYL